MIKRIVLGVIVVTALVWLIVYSQIRVTQPFVSGFIETDEIRLGSRVGGRVKLVFVEEGDRVSAGTPLLEFEPYDLLERERQAVAELAVRDAELKRLRAGFRVEEIGQAKSRVEQLTAQLQLLEIGPRPEEIDAAQERMNAANAQLQLAKREYDRRANLAQSIAESLSELDIAKEKFDAATADMRVKKNELAILQAGARPQEIEHARAKVQEAQLAWELAQKGYRLEEIEQAEAARNATAAALEVIRQQKTELKVLAPSDGFVDALDLQAGDLVGPNAPVMTILSDQHLWVRAYVPQHFLRMDVGQQLRVTIDSFPAKDFQGVLSYISQHAEFTPSNVQTVEDRAKQVYRIRVTLTKPDSKLNMTEGLRSGMTANVWLDSSDGGSAK